MVGRAVRWWLARGRRRLVGRIAFGTLVVMALVTAVPDAGLVPASEDGFPLSWLAGVWLAPPGWAAPPAPPTPVQQHGSAKGLPHQVGVAATRVGRGVGRPRGLGRGELAPVKPVVRDTKGGKTPPLPTAFSFDPRTSKRLAAQATQTSDTFQNLDGSRTRKVFDGPVNFKASGGTWTPIDTTLAGGTGGRVRERANAIVADFAPLGNDPALAALRFDATHAVSWGVQGAAAVPVQVSGSTATYPRALAQTDVTLTSTAGGIKEALVLQSADAPTSWVFPLHLQGLTARLAADGAVEFVDAGGAVQGRAPPGVMTDANVDPHSLEGVMSTAVTYALSTVGGAQVLTMTADANWLHDPARVYPVTVDPTVQEYAVGGTYVESSYTNDNSGSTDLRVGTYDGTHKAYGFLQFSTFGRDFAGTHLSAVSLHVNTLWTYSCRAAEFAVNPITQPWGTSTTKSYPGPSFGAAIGRLSADPGSACTNSSLSPSKSKEMVVPLGVDTFNNWANGGTNYGLALTASLTNKDAWKRIESTNSTHPPYLAVTYADNVPPQLDSMFPPDGYDAQTLTPQLMVSGHDPDNFPAGGVNFCFAVFSVDSAGTTTQIAISGWSWSTSWIVPAGVLRWGQHYVWSVASGDGALASPWSSHLISTPVRQPAITSKLSQNSGGHGFDANIGNYTTSVTDAQIATVGPSLSVLRNYNSADPRVSGAFGGGWSSLVDSRAVDQTDAAGVVQTVVVTYPDGSEIAYGRNSDGSFTPPEGRFATFATVTGGYRLIDKNDTTYTFTQALGSGSYGLTSVTDASGRVETLGYASSQVSTMTAASGRALHLTWSTPSGATAAHVATVATDPAVTGDTSTISTWTYAYTGDTLTTVCPPTSAVACTTYGSTPWSGYPNVENDLGPHSLWRLSETSGIAAASTVLGNAHTDDATYSNVALGQPGHLPGSGATSAGFDGTSSSVKLPASLVQEASNQSVSLWFKTSTPDGVLFGYEADPLTNNTTPANYGPALYVGSDGKLNGEFWTGAVTPIVSAAPVTDGAWHHALLSGAGNTQSLYLDGALVGSLNGVIALMASGTTNEYVGAGFLGGPWPDQPHHADNTGYATYFNGSIADVAFYTTALGAPEARQLNTGGRRAGSVLSSITRPTGSVYAEIDYDAVSGAVKQVTDEHGGVWKIGAPQVNGSSQVFAGAVLGAAPADYWRFGEAGTPQDAVNQVNGGRASYSNVLLGGGGAFTGDTFATAATFDGSTSYVKLPDQLVSDGGNQSVGMWFRTTTANGVLFSYSKDTIAPSTAGDFLPALYVGADGSLYGEFYYNHLTTPIRTPASVTDGNWHYAVLAAATDSQSLYLDGNLVGSVSGHVGFFDANNGDHAYIGAGFIGGPWPSEPNAGTSSYLAEYFTGTISDVAFYHSQVSAGQVSSQYQAAKSATGTAPAVSVTVTDPGGKPSVDTYDPLKGYRQIAQVDGDGHATTFGYDTGGFLNTTTDANGNLTVTGHDVRGNTVSQTACQDRKNNKCSTTYYTYYPDDTSATLSPDPRNDMLLTVRDGRSASATDNTYLTTTAYDSAGNRTSVTTPPVPGFASGRTITTAYTTATTLAVDGGVTPAGLPMSVTTPGGATQTMRYNHNGDVAEVVDAAGQLTRYSYDNLGRVLTATVVSDTYPAGLTTTYTYTGLGQPVTETDPPVTDRVTGATHTAKTTTRYDGDGNVVSQSVADLTGGDATRTVASTYNTHGQPDSQTDASNATTTYGYDAYGNKVKQVNPLGVETDYSYDTNSRLLTTTLKGYTGDPNDPHAPSDLVESSRAYDPGGRLASVTDSMGWVVSYTYFDDGRLATVTRTDPVNHRSFVQQDNTYDAAGNMTSQKTNNATTTTTFNVDAASRTASATLDPGGLNRTTTYVYSPDDAVLTTTLGDASGAKQVTDATYDPLGRPTSQTVHLDGTGNPSQWWRLADSAGTAAVDSSGAGQTGIASNVTWGGGAASFNGTSSSVQLPDNLATQTGNQSISLWFKTTTANGVLFSYETDRVTGAPGSTTTAGFVPAMYVGSDGKLLAGYYQTAVTPMRSPAAVTDGQWHHVVLAASGSGQVLYLDGAQIGTSSVPVSTGFTSSFHDYLGGGFVGGSWPDHQYTSPGSIVGHLSYFTGQMSNVEFYGRALSAGEASTLRGNGRTGNALNAKVLTTAWALDQRGLPTAMTDPNGNVTSYGYDEAGRLAVTTAPTISTEVGGGPAIATHPITMVGYDTFGSRVETSDPNGNVTVAGYDAAGRPVSVRLPDYTAPGSATPIQAVSLTSYDALGQVLTRTDALQHVTSYAYDQLGDVSSMTAPNTGVTRYAYDTNGDRLSATDPTGARSAATYDWLGHAVTQSQVVRQATPATYTTNLAYTPAGYLASTTTPSQVTTSSTYNAAGQPVTVTDGANNTTRYDYDYAGRAVKTTLPDGTAQRVTYDAAGRAVTSASLDSSGAALATQSTVYDNNGNATATTDARNTTTTFAYDATDLLTQEVQPATATSSITTGFGYDAAGHRTRYTDGRGNPFITTYNAWGLQESRIEPSTPAHPALADRTFTWVYDANGQSVAQRLPGGVSVSNAYDSVGDLTGQTGTGAEVATAARSFGYDLAGRPTSASAPGGTDSFSYDDRGLLLSASGPSGSSSFAYTGDGLMASRTDAAGTTAYTYDGADRLSTVNNTTTGVAAAVSYNPMSLPARITYGAGENRRTLGYDGLHRLTSDVLTTAGGAGVASIGYGYDANSNVTSKTTAGFAGSSSNVYTYDLADRLTSWNNGSTTLGYSYDASGNRTQVGAQSFAYDARDELVTGGTTSYTYTARGTLASTVNGATTKSQMDAFGQTVTAGGQAYGYDALGRMVTATGVSGLAYTGMENTLASDGSAVYTRGPDGDVLGAASGSTQRLVWTDAHTDVVGQFTASGAALAGSATYDPLGAVTATSSQVGNLGYQSGWTDRVANSVNMAARWYNPATGGFTSRDSVDVSAVPDSAQANPFAYVGDNPLGGTDPTGHKSRFSLGGFFSGIGHGITHSLSSAWNWTSQQAIQAYNGATNWVDSTVNSFVKKATDFYNDPVGTAKTIVKETVHWVDAKAAEVRDGAVKLKNEAIKKANEVKRQATNIVHKAVQVASDPVHAVQTAYHAVAAGVNAAGQFLEAHAASIASFVVSTAVFAGCEALTGGLGSIGCGALSGAIGSMVEYGVNAAQSGKFSWSGLGKAALTGAVSGALGGMLGALGGKAFSFLAGKAGGLLRGGLDAGAEAGGEGGAAAGGRELASGAESGAARNAGEAAEGGAARNAGEAAESREGSGASCTVASHSFDPATAVLLADGSHKPIKDVRLGDRVVSADPATGADVSESVVALHDNHDTDLADVRVQAADGSTATLHTTWHHPFWDAGAKRWVEAADLKPGTRLHTTTGATEQVVAVKTWTGLRRMNDLTIATTHTYYVIAGTTPVLVHNTNGPIGCATDGRPIYDIPAGSSGGFGAGKRIPPDMLRDYNIGVNADPSLPSPVCSYCRTNTANAVDHVEPRIRGGDLTDANTTPACTPCNSSKRDFGAPLNPPASYTGPWPPPHWPPHITR